MKSQMLRAVCARLGRSLLPVAAFALAPMTFVAQASPAAEPAGTDRPAGEELVEVVVTGTSLARTRFETPLSVTQFDEAELLRLRSSSQADILATIPGLKAEGGGGELAANVQVRGLPSAGQYQFTPLEYNGVPVFSTFGLNSSAFDVYARDDLGVERLEYVSGGVSNLFGPGSVAGIINYIDKTGSATPEGILQGEVASERRFRGDFFASGPLGGSDSNTFFAMSGFYRYDEGPLDTDLETNGFQLRGNIKREIEGGSVTLYAQVIDDRAQFFVPIPLDPVNKERVRGVDGRTVYSLDTNAIDGMRTVLNDGSFTLDHVNDGVATSGGSVYGVLDKKVGNDWTLNVKGKYAKYRHRFGIFDATDGLVNVPETLGQFIANRNLGSSGTPVFTYTESGLAVPSNTLLEASRFTDRNRPATDFSGEASLSRRFGSTVTNDVTIGTFISRSEARDIQRTVRYLTDFKNAPDLVNLRFTSGTTTTGTYSQNGFTGVVGYANNKNAALRTALYIANQMQSDRWSFDAGARVERLNGTATRETTRNVVLDSAFYTAQTGAVAPQSNLLTVTNGSGLFRHGKVSTTGWDVSVGALYKLTDSINVYANASRGFFFPALNGVAFSPIGEPQSIEPEDIVMGELGMKFSTSVFNGSVAAFYMTDKNRRQVVFINGPGGSIVESAFGLATKGYGVELNGSYRLAGAFSIDTNLTFQDHEYTRYDATPAFIGNELLRKPKVLANVGLTYDQDRFFVSVFDNYQGNNYANDSQLAAVRLDSYHLVRLNMGYRFDLAGSRATTLALDVFNLLDGQGLAEGNPRAFNAQTGTEAYFVGRPILPRRYTLRLTMNF